MFLPSSAVPGGGSFLLWNVAAGRGAASSVGVSPAFAMLCSIVQCQNEHTQGEIGHRASFRKNRHFIVRMSGYSANGQSIYYSPFPTLGE